MTSQSAIHAYRDLLRSARIAFQGDTHILTSALSRARTAFETHRSESGPGIGAAIRHAEEVARLLRENVVQGVRVQEGEGKGDGGERYQLRIHEYTERGDNDSIKRAGKGGATMGGCCGGAGAR
ncbi:MAG: Mitochondrial zinc maintenance protein 1, mitochondrial [Heterodermia speciosa]|uniref:Mitochondrial zinc maintenance protein 1, mitochondrial n=1 Tax=Heterodermia speciosa TaxID=116794 RepID=A0A8H3IQQ5_9LECA|nr:MAG: Mitochondrial zinc maintenance protein 1, mitochondrial [Heterodermia speciosa]